jgi:hypothetical protein
VDALQKQSELAEAAKVRIEAARGRLAAIPVIDLDEARADAAMFEDISSQKKALALKLKAEYQKSSPRTK